MDLMNGGLAEPALTGHFAGNRGFARGRRPGEGFAQVKIAANTFRVIAIQAEDGPGMLRIDGVFDLPVSRGAFRVEISKFNGQRFQVAKLLGKAWRRVNPSGFFLTVIQSRRKFSWVHEGMADVFIGLVLLPQ